MIELDEKRKAGKGALTDDEEGRPGEGAAPAGRKRQETAGKAMAPKRGEGAEVEGKMVRLPRALWDMVDAYWHDNRLSSRTAAVRALLERGLK